MVDKPQDKKNNGEQVVTEIKKFMDLLKGTDIEELQWESDGMKIHLKRSESEIIPEHPAELKQDTSKEKKTFGIKSPMVGIFHRAQSPDYPPLVMEGNHVVPGQKVAIIEAMKIMKDVISSVKGRIVSVLVEDGAPVEYAQELFLVDSEPDIY
ncbi:MAG: biotin/lipoyl-containing protein [Elusimicrobiota bacterium]